MNILQWIQAKRPSNQVIKGMQYTLWGMALMAIIATCTAPFYSFAINMDHSLPGHLFFIHKGEYPKKGELVAFEFQGYEPWFPKGTIFVKKLSGTAGDVVTATNHQGCVSYQVNDTVIGCSRPKTHDGHILVPGPVGRVPEGRIVVRGTSYDSFDSRYAGVGWIRHEQVIGHAYRIF